MRYAKQLCCLLVLLFASSAAAQVFIKKGDGKNEMKVEGEPFNLGELGAVIMQEDGKVKVMHAVEKDRRPKGYADVDLKADDIIVMANAKKIESSKALKELYEALAVGAELKLGVKRGEQMFIAVFPKADPSALPKMKMRMMTSTDGGNIQVFPAVGVVLSENKDKHVIIADKFPDSTAAAASANVRANDQILEMNGKRISSLNQYTQMYDAIAVGANVTWKLRRSDQTISISFVKPTPRGGMIRREIKK